MRVLPFKQGFALGTLVDIYQHKATRKPVARCALWVNGQGRDVAAIDVHSDAIDVHFDNLQQTTSFHLGERPLIEIILSRQIPRPVAEFMQRHWNDLLGTAKIVTPPTQH